MSDSFGLKAPDKFSIFQSTDPKRQKREVVNIEAKHLFHFHDHPYPLYSGERFEEMVESIKTNGIFTPLIVRPMADDKFNYEILAGHNRYECGKAAGLEVMPCVVEENLTEAVARLIVVESNHNQRSSADLSHSTLAKAIAMHYNAIKAQGKRTDLIADVENLIQMLENPDNARAEHTSAPSDQKLGSRERTGQKYGLSRPEVARYLRLNELIDDFKELLDDNDLSKQAGVALSYVGAEQQQQICDYMIDNDVKINVEKAEQLRKLYTDGHFTLIKMEEIFLGKKSPKRQKPKQVIQIKRKSLENYFNNDESEENIAKEIMTALDFYHKYKNEFPALFS